MAIVPRNVFRSDRDRALVAALDMRYGIRVQEEGAKVFPGVHAKVELLRLGLASKGRRAPEPTVEADAGRDIVRGSLPVHKAVRAIDGESGRVFLHSSDLSSLPHMPQVRVLNGKATDGVGVFLPRVGYATVGNVKAGEVADVVLSDCVLMIRCESFGQAEVLRGRMLDQLGALRAIYAGSCAPYLTLTLLKRWLLEELA